VILVDQLIAFVQSLIDTVDEALTEFDAALDVFPEDEPIPYTLAVT
jgi:hypothetical protein